MANTDYIPEQGDIAWMILDPRVGHEQSGRRPAIVLSHKELAEHTNLVVVSPITSGVKGFPYEIILRGTSTKGAVLSIHVRSVDFRKRKAVFIEKAPPKVLAKAIKAVQNMID
ncbi:MAG TPA: type II toxin-antitoxin system PemK/MazF family toxin [Candidatus Saccharimonadales bacterium]|nr:type II toxin-antitoxin system PemK/MazF family toxin [Candidatus Saccharimonadales bacterium]